MISLFYYRGDDFASASSFQLIWLIDWLNDTAWKHDLRPTETMPSIDHPFTLLPTSTSTPYTLGVMITEAKLTYKPTLLWDVGGNRSTWSKPKQSHRNPCWLYRQQPRTGLNPGLWSVRQHSAGAFSLRFRGTQKHAPELLLGGEFFMIIFFLLFTSTIT